MLPRIVALGDIDEDELAFADEAEQLDGAAPLDIPPKLGELERRLTLAHLVAAWAKGAVLAPLVVGGPASTLALASRSRAADRRHGDARRRRGSALDGLVPDQLDEYWKHSLEFLQHRAQGLAGSSRRDRQDRAGGAARSPDRGRSRAADRASQGTGDRGGLDRLDAGDREIPACGGEAAAWRGGAARARHRSRRGRRGAASAASATTSGKFTEHPASNHPQFAMHALLERFGIKRGDVDILGTPAPDGRDVLLSEAMRPSQCDGAMA